MPDVIVVGGDVASGPLPRETLDLLAALPGDVRFVRGNSDRMLLQFLEGTRVPDPAPAPDDAWVVDQLRPRDGDLLRTFAGNIKLVIDDIGATLFCHGSPSSDEKIITALTPERRLADSVEGFGACVVCGHTHVQFDRTVGGTRIVNAGSVGMPYEDRGPGAYWVLLGPDVELRRTRYDIDGAAKRIRGSSWPGAGDFAAENVLTVPSGREAARYFEELAAEQEGL